MRITPLNCWIERIVRMSIGTVFLYAGATKAHNPQSFADSIADFQLVPNALINILALSLPLFEIIVGMMLLLGWHKRAAVFSVILLLFVFTCALVEALVRGLDIDCGCFGSEQGSVWNMWGFLGRDLLLLFIATLLYLKMNSTEIGTSSR